MSVIRTALWICGNIMWIFGCTLLSLHNTVVQNVASGTTAQFVHPDRGASFLWGDALVICANTVCIGMKERAGIEYCILPHVSQFQIQVDTPNFRPWIAKQKVCMCTCSNVTKESGRIGIDEKKKTHLLDVSCMFELTVFMSPPLSAHHKTFAHHSCCCCYRLLHRSFVHHAVRHVVPRVAHPLCAALKKAPASHAQSVSSLPSCSIHS